MKAVGLVTEYNPFHNGHLYHLNKAMELTGADVSIAVMSGNFVQRGEPAVLDKYTRAAMALNSGVNLVIELPVNYAVSSAESFAVGALKVLNYIQADSIAFGSESGDIDILLKVAHVLCDNDAAMYKEISKYTSNGISYAVARQKVLEKLTDKDTAAILTSSNNILAVEYLKAIIKHDYDIKPYTVQRQGDGYNAADISSTYASATALRGNLKSAEPHVNIHDYMPEKAALILQSDTNYIYPDDVSGILSARLLDILFKSDYEKNSFIENAMEYPDVSKEIAGRIYKVSMDVVTRENGAFSFDDIADRIKTKEITLSRVKRVLIRIMLGLDSNHLGTYEKQPYIRVLGFDRKGQEYLSYIRKKVEVPLVIKTVDYKELLIDDIHAANVYNMITAHKYGVSAQGDYVRGPVRL